MAAIEVMTGAELRRLRLAAGLTQRELGRRLGRDGNTVARYERDEIRVPPPTAQLVRLWFPSEGDRHARTDRRERGATV